MKLFKDDDPALLFIEIFVLAPIVIFFMFAQSCAKIAKKY